MQQTRQEDSLVFEKYKIDRKFVWHPYIQYQIKEGWRSVKGIQTVILFFMIITATWPIFLKTFDFTISLLMMFCWIFIFPFMKRGWIKVYYRRDYEDLDFLFWTSYVLIQGAFVRNLMVMFYYGASLYLSWDNKYDKAHYLLDVQDFVVNPIPSIIACLYFLLYIYFVFYRERYITAKDYTREIKPIYKRYKNLWLANLELIKRKDWELAKKELNHVKYPLKEQSMNDFVNYDCQETNNNLQSNQEEPEKKKENKTDDDYNDDVMIRRRLRI